MSVNQAIVASPANVGGSEDKQNRQGDLAATRGQAFPGAVWSASILVLTVLAGQQCVSSTKGYVSPKPYQPSS
jgi:hypothetical protein